jgi:hypothetical protein
MAFSCPLYDWRGVLDTTLCDKVCRWLATGQWFSASYYQKGFFFNYQRWKLSPKHAHAVTSIKKSTVLKLNGHLFLSCHKSSYQLTLFWEVTWLTSHFSLSQRWPLNKGAGALHRGFNSTCFISEHFSLNYLNTKFGKKGKWMNQ